MEQLAFIDEIPKVQYVRQTERALYEYASLKVALQNEEELEKEGLGNLFPSMISSYDDSPRGGTISNPTESWGIRRAEKKIKVKQIDRALGVLSKEERDLIQTKYLTSYQPTDTMTMQQIQVSQANYYRIKDRALRKMATALNII